MVGLFRSQSLAQGLKNKVLAPSAWQPLNSEFLYFIKRDEIRPTILWSSGTSGLVVRHLLSDLNRSTCGKVLVYPSGTASELGGGKFANGAVTGAFAYSAGNLAQRLKTPELSYTTFEGPTNGPGSVSRWKIGWDLSETSAQGGWVVQEMNVNIVENGIARNYQYWEAWPVESGARSGGYDDWSSNAGATGSGSISWSGSARFYDGLELPSSFKPFNVDTLAGRIRSTAVNPNLPVSRASSSVNRSFSHEW